MAPARVAPSLSWTIEAVEGRKWSGEQVATMMRSRSRGLVLAILRAWRAERSARSEVASPWAIRWRCLMPVRLVIHSSEVSRPLATRSSLVTTLGGTYIPQPVIWANGIGKLILLSGRLGG